MKILIVYATKSGSSRFCAELLRDKLGHRYEVTCSDIADAPAPDAFDVAVVGGSIRFEKLDKRLKAYVKANRARLESMPAAFFLCCGFPVEWEDYADAQLPNGMKFSLGRHCFGGELKPEKWRGLDKFLVKRMRGHIRSRDFEEGDKNDHPLPELIPEHVSLLAEAIFALENR